MTDRRLRDLERVALQGRPEDLHRWRSEQLRFGVLGREYEDLVGWCVDPYTGKVIEDAVIVVEWILSGELAHGSWVKLTRRDDGKRWKHPEGDWWCLHYWMQGHVQAEWDTALLPAGVEDHRSRPKHGKLVGRYPTFLSGNRWESFFWLAENLIETYRPGLGPKIFDMENRLRAAKGQESRAKRKGNLIRLRAAQDLVASIEKNLEELKR